ncbi:hypothetical protein CL617_03845 [archaeon]|nr:hypothetical protein [archaeon]|tara:strand:- start:25232 stop:26242 length:1011 start_codon:yes stop_codon:yes gene_type:complete
MQHNKSCNHCNPKDNSKIKISKNLKITGTIFILVFLISFLPIFESLNESLISFLKLIWWAILIGFFIGGLIDYFVPEEFIFKYLGQKNKKSIFYAVIGGFLMSACSHGILAISMQLYKKGASIPAVITFLLASPWANLPITILLFGFFGIKALYFILAAMFIAVVTGFIYLLLEKYNLIEKSKKIILSGDYQWEKIKNFNFNESVKGTFHGSISLANMVLWWILIGFLIAAIIGAYVPSHIFVQYFGPTFLGLLLTLAFATIIEVCSEGSSPIAFEIFNKVGVLGNPFVFLMAGVATDYTEIGLIWSNIGKRTAIYLPIITVPQILLIGYLFNIFL